MAAERDVDGLISGPPAQRQTAAAAFQASPTIGKLAGALAKAQGAFEPIGKTREVTVQTKAGGNYKFAYAPLDEVLRSVRPAMAENGLAITQTISDGADGRTMTTTLLHESGEFLASTTTLPGQASTAQEFGSQITYMRRYAIVSILGVVADEDDDGNHADGNVSQGKDRKANPPARQATPPKQQSDNATKSLDRTLTLQKLLGGPPPDGLGWPIPKCKNWLRKYFHVDGSQELTAMQMADALALAETHVKQGEIAYRAELKKLHEAGRVFDGEAA